MASAEDPSNDGKASDTASIIPTPGELVLKKLFAQFVVSSKGKLNHISTQPLVSDSYTTDTCTYPTRIPFTNIIIHQANPLSQYLQKGEDLNFDQLLLSLKDVASFCLRSLLIALNDWRKLLMKQIKTSPRGFGISPGYDNKYAY